MTAACPACVAAPAALELAEVAAARPFSVPSIHCAVCIGAIETHLASVKGVRDARVNATQKRVMVSSTLPDAQVVEELKSIGYEAFPLDQAALSCADDSVGRGLLLRMGVAGFAMMNVMLLSVAVWSGASDATRDLFHLISAMIALPAVIYAARPFFDHAWQALRARRMNMDVPISLAIALAALMSLYEALNGGAHAYFDAALSLTFFLLIGRYLEHRTKSAARSAASELAALEVHTAYRRIKGNVENVSVNALQVGDVVLVHSGMRVPVDGDLLSDQAFTDRSFLTGESEPVEHSLFEPLCAGEVNLGAPFEIKVTAIGQDTRLSRIAALVATAENARNTYTSLADKAAQIYAPVVHILAALSFAGWMLFDGDLRHALNVAIAVLIITCPCALGLAVPAVSTAAISRLYRLGFLVKSGTALERLAVVRTMVFDKTGTLTKPGFAFDLGRLSAEQKAVAKALADQSSHPLSKTLSSHLVGTQPAALDDVAEVTGQGIEGRLNGKTVALGRAAWVGARGDDLTLSIDKTSCPLTPTQTVLENAASLAPRLRILEITAEILSGDTEEKTRELAQSLSFEHWRSGISPEQKANIIQGRRQNAPVCMVGDGINDTAALANASVSIAPGTALDATRNAADVIIVGDALEQIPTVIQVARKAVQLSKQNFGIAVLYNLIAIPIAVSGFATPLVAALAMSASSITVLCNAMRVRW